MLRRYLDPYQPKPEPTSSFWNVRSGADRWAQARHWLDILVGQARRNQYVGHLKAAVYADMVGYSRLFRQDDAGTVARLRNMHRLLGPAIRRHYGSLVQTAGDSLLITFDSITEAVRCAVTIQHAVAKENDGWPDDRRMWLRVGVDLGDVITDGRDFHGDGVIVAVRLQEVCPPGGVCISRAVHEHGGDRLGLPFEALGALTLKNIVHPVEAFVLRPPHDERTATLRLVE
jgi:class 3 adenylate cyclase